MNLTKTIITYYRRAYCAYVCYYYDNYLLMSKLVVLECAIGYKQFYPMGSPKVPQNRLFAQFFFSGHQIDEMKSGIISSIVTESFTQGVIFATVAFGVGIDSIYVERVIHFGVPRTMESFFQECGRTGRGGRQFCIFSVCQQ